MMSIDNYVKKKNADNEDFNEAEFDGLSKEDKLDMYVKLVEKAGGIVMMPEDISFEVDSVVDGDVVVFFSIDTVSGEQSGHIGIVYAVSEENLSVAHQNFNADKLKQSFVKVSVLSDIVSGSPSEKTTILYFRPF